MYPACNYSEIKHISSILSVNIWNNIIKGTSDGNQVRDLGSTGYGNGTAFPHARIEGLNKVRAVFARLTTPIDFNAVDGKPVDLIFLLISPENSGADHLTALAALSRILKSEDICEKLRGARSREEIYAILNN